VDRLVPNQFHFVYGLKEQKEPFHLIHYLCIESCRRVNRPERMFFHYHHEPHGRYWDMTRDKVTRVKVDLLPLVSEFEYGDKHVRQYSYAHQSDFIRLDALIEHGGVYADIDTIFVNKIPERLFSMPFVLGREEAVRCQATGRLVPSLCNALIMSRPRAEFAVRWRGQMEEAFDGTWSGHSTLLPRRLAAAHPELIHVEPPGTFYRYMWTREGLRRLLQECERVDDSVASVHLWAHLWWSKKRRDSSDFHAGLATEKRIRKVDTTYNLLAREYLPAGRRRRSPLQALARCKDAVLQRLGLP